MMAPVQEDRVYSNLNGLKTVVEPSSLRGGNSPRHRVFICDMRECLLAESGPKSRGFPSYRLTALAASRDNVHCYQEQWPCTKLGFLLPNLLNIQWIHTCR